MRQTNKVRREICTVDTKYVKTCNRLQVYVCAVRNSLNQINTFNSRHLLIDHERIYTRSINDSKLEVRGEDLLICKEALTFSQHY